MKQESCANYPWPYSAVILMALFALFLWGCAGGSAKQVGSRGSEPLSPPPVFLIYNFAVDPEDVLVDTDGLSSGDEASGIERLTVGKEWANALSESLVRQLVEEGITARRATGSTYVPLNAIVVKGQFISIDEGDKMKRTTIGLGAGDENVNAMVQVYQMRQAGLMRISEVESEAHGEKTPGVATAGVITLGTGSVIGLVLSSAKNIDDEVIDGSMQTTVDNLAEELVERTVDYYEKRGWRL